MLRVHVVRRVVLVRRHRVEVLAQSGATVPDSQTGQIERVRQTQTRRAGVQARRARVGRRVGTVEVNSAELKSRSVQE